MTVRRARAARRARLGWVAVGLIAAIAAAPQAGADISDTIFTIEAVNGSGSGEFFATFDEGNYDPATNTFTWSLPAPVDLLDGGSGALIATLQDASLTIHDGVQAPDVDLGFEVVAGSRNTDFFIDSALISFGRIPADLAAGRFAVSGTVWDQSAPSDGVWMIGLGPQMGIYQSYYNGPAPDGSVFRELLAVVGSDGGGSTTSGSEVYPGAGHAPIGVDVQDMSIYAAFLLTADDRAQGTATFELVPEPAGLTLLALGAMLATRRRRA